MALDVEGVVNRCVRGEESLGGGLGFEPLLLPLSSSGWQVRVLDPIIFPKLAWSMQIPQIQLVQSRAVGGQTVGRDRLRVDRLVVQQPPEQP